jgi:predicted Zn-dependent peptidase
MIIAAAGDIDHDSIVSEMDRRLASIPSTASLPAPRARYSGGLELGARNLEQAHLVFGLEACSYLAPEFYAMQVFANVLGGGSSSRLFQEVREKRGLCYSIYAYHQAFADSGIFGIYSGTDPGDTRELMTVVIEQLADAADTAHEAEIGRAKALIKVSLLGVLESSVARADQLGRQLLAYGRPLPLDELVARIDAVSVDDVRAAARALISSGRPTFAGLGPRAGLESAARIAESLERRAA